MTFEEVLDQAIAMLQRLGRVTYRTLKRQFNLDDEALEDLKEELIEAEQLAVDQGGKILVWTGDTTSASTPGYSIQEPTASPVSAFASQQKQPPLAYTPAYLSEKILNSRSALAGERKQVTVMFADIKDSTELIRDLDPEAAQRLLDPAIHIMMECTTIENEEQKHRAADPLFSDDAVFTDNAPADLAQHHDRYLYAEQAS